MSALFSALSRSKFLSCRAVTTYLFRCILVVGALAILFTMDLLHSSAESTESSIAGAAVAERLEGSRVPQTRIAESVLDADRGARLAHIGKASASEVPAEEESLDAAADDAVVAVAAAAAAPREPALLPTAPADRASPLVRKFACGFAIGGAVDTAMQYIELRQDDGPRRSPNERFRYKSLHDLDARRLLYAACWGSALQLALLPWWFAFLESWSQLDHDARLIVDVSASIVVASPALLAGSYLQDFERGWLQGKAPVLALLDKYRTRARQVPIPFLLWVLFWPLYFFVCFEFLPESLRCIATALAAGCWHLAVVFFLRRQVHAILGIEPLGELDACLHRGLHAGMLSLSSTLNGAMHTPDFKATHEAALAAMFEALPASMMQENQPIVVQAIATIVPHYDDDAGGSAAGACAGLPASPAELPESLSPAEVQDACREAMLRSIRQSAPPAIQQFLEANIELLNMGGSSAARSSALPRLGLGIGGAVGGAVAPVAQVAEEEEEDDDEALFAPPPGSYHALAAALDDRGRGRR